jgi:hypothetical protein
MNTIPITIVYQGMLLKGYANTLESLNDVPSSLSIYIQGWFIGNLANKDNKWKMDQPIDIDFIDALGNYITSYMRSVKKAMSYSYFS